ncbi:MAG: hypothetical protein GY778_15950, partial [bacterium]|nr:hypothetical protein [bacterium]
MSTGEPIATPAPGAPAGAPGGPVLRLAPADALAVLYARDLGGLLDNPALAIVASEGGPDLPTLGRAWQAVFDGPTMIAVRAPALHPQAISICLAARVSADEAEWYRALDERLAPALSLGECSDALFETGRSGDFITIRATEPPYLTMYLAYRDGLVFGSTALPAAMQFAEGNDPGPSFVESDDFRRLPVASDARAAERVDLLAYLNLRPLMALL